jgi:hypothetical protein
MPNADQGTLTMAAVWLVGQWSVFVTESEAIGQPTRFAKL